MWRPFRARERGGSRKVTGLAGFTYAQARLQARYGKRADARVWVRLQNIHDLASYLQAAQQTPLRPWVLGIGSTHSSHDIELALRQRYRNHVDEVAGWLPRVWQAPLRWISRLADLSMLQYLLAGGTPMDWMRSDPWINDFIDADPALRALAMRKAGCESLVNAWQQGESMFKGWLLQWNEARPVCRAYNDGLRAMEQLLSAQLSRNAQQMAVAVSKDYAAEINELSVIFRRYALEPAGVCAYLAIVAVDLQHIRSDLIQRIFFQGDADHAEELPV